MKWTEVMVFEKDIKENLHFFLNYKLPWIKIKTFVQQNTSKKEKK